MYTHFLENQEIVNYNEHLIETLKHYNFSDLSYGNDCCNSMGKDYKNSKFYFTIYLPNSKTQDYEQEKHNTFYIMLVAPDLYIDPLYEKEFETLEDALSFILSNSIIKERK